MKKGLRLVILLSLVLLISLAFVSAQSSTQNAFKPIFDILSSLINGLVDVARPILEFLLGSLAASSKGPGGVSGLFLAKLFALIVVFSVSYVVLSQINLFSEKPWVLWVITVAVSLLSVRFIPTEAIYLMTAPSTALGIAVTAVIPFIIWFTFVNMSSSPTLRRLAWIFYALIFFSLYIYYAPYMPNYGWVYPLMAIIALVMAIMDGTIKRLWSRIKAEKSLNITDKIRYTQMLKHREELSEAHLNAIKGNQTTLATTIENELVKIDKWLETKGFK